MSDEEEGLAVGLGKLHGLLAGMLEDQRQQGLLYAQLHRKGEGGGGGTASSIDDADVQQILEVLRNVESENERLSLDLSQFDRHLLLEPLAQDVAHRRGLPNGASPPPAEDRPKPLDRLEAEVRGLALAGQETEAQLAELGDVLSACLHAVAATSRQRPPPDHSRTSPSPQT